MTSTSHQIDGLLETSRSFIAQRIAPIEQEVADTGEMDPATWLSLIQESVDLGLYTANVPAEFGGPGLSVVEQTQLWEEFGATCWPFTYLLARPHRVLFECNADQRARYLEPLLRGEKEHCFALTEPGAGSDNSALSTEARKVDGGYSITGTKHFIGHGGADFAIVFAKTGPPLRGRTPQVTAFLVDRGTEGYTVSSPQRMMGWSGMNLRQLDFDNCFVPDEQVLGTPGRGLSMALASVAQRRIQIAAYCVGAMERLLQLSVDYTHQRVVFDQPLIDKQGIQWMLAEAAMEPYLAREATYKAARLCDEAKVSGRTEVELSRLFAKEISIAKLYASQALNRVADVAVQVHGGRGWCRDYAVERLYRDARVFRIIEGADEVHKQIIGRSLAVEQPGGRLRSQTVSERTT